MPHAPARPSAPLLRLPVRRLGAVGGLLALAAVCTAAAPGVVRIGRGDTLSGIAARTGTTVAALKAANGLTSDAIYAGNTLVLPGAPAAPADVTSRAATSAAQHRAVLAARTQPSKATARALVGSAARRYGVDTSLALAVAYHESGFQQRVVSGVDAIGVMQVLPSTGARLASTAGRPLDLLRAEDNVAAGVLLLRQLRATTGSDEAALAAYYQGLGSIAKKGLLPQTTAYVANVQALRPRFRG